VPEPPDQHSTRQYLAQLLAAYERVHATPQQGPASSSFDGQLQESVLRYLDMDDQLLIRAGSRAVAEALRHARVGALRQARQALRQAEDAAKSSGPLAQALSHSFHAAALAYVECRAAQFHRAHELLRESLDADARLIRECGWGVLVAHQIQVGHNVMRLRAKEGNVLGAAGTGAGLLAFLEGDDTAWPITDHSGVGDLAAAPTELLIRLANQIMGEFALLCSRYPADNERLLVAMEQHRRASPSCSRLPVCHEWLAVKRLLVAGTEDAYLSAATDFVAQGIRDAPVLWYATYGDVLGRWRASRRSAGVAAAKELAGVLQSPGSLRDQFRSLLDVTGLPESHGVVDDYLCK